MLSEYKDEYLPVERLKQFELFRLINRGPRSAVYVARDGSQDRRVAIKLLNRDLATDANVVWRFFAQATAAARVQHRMVAQTLFVGQEGPYSFCVREFVDGDSLGSRLAEGQNFSTDELLEAAIRILEALAATHAHGIEHGNLHSENVLFDRVEERLVLTDFHGPEPSATTATGDSTVNARRDLRGVGSLVQQMLMGFDATSAFSANTKTVSSVDLTKFIERLMGKGAAPPFQSAVEALVAARRLAGFEPPLSMAELGAADNLLRHQVSPCQTNVAAVIELPKLEAIPDLPDDVLDADDANQSRRWWQWFGRRSSDETPRRLQEAHATIEAALAEMQRRQRWLDRLDVAEQAVLELLQHPTDEMGQSRPANPAAQAQAIERQQRLLAHIKQRRAQLAEAVTRLESQRDVLIERLPADEK